METPLRTVGAWRVAGPSRVPKERVVPEETPLALVYDGATHAVMMATPEDLEDFAIGFSCADGKIGGLSDIHDLEIVRQPQGIEARIWLTPDAGRREATRRRAMLGPTGCGLCGVDSLDAALPPVPKVGRGLRFTQDDVFAALAAIEQGQTLNRETRALHAAAYWQPRNRAFLVREDVGRHNALDKLAGALMRSGTSADELMIVVTSRLSVEMVQKVAIMGATVVVAVSTPTALALRVAREAGMTVVGIARSDAFEIFNGPERFDGEAQRSETHFDAAG